jgi:hypothetical protein
VLAVHRPPYGFRYNDARDNYLVDAERMAVIERIFRMVGVEGYTMNATRLAFNREGVCPPSGEFWSPKYILVYGMLRLKVEVAADGTMVARGIPSEDWRPAGSDGFCENGLASTAAKRGPATVKRRQARYKLALDRVGLTFRVFASPLSYGAKSQLALTFAEWGSVGLALPLPPPCGNQSTDPP